MDWTDIIIGVLTLLLTIISAVVAKYVIPYLEEKGLDIFTQKLVTFAWQIYQDGEGAKKFQYVFDKLNAKYGKYYDEEKIKQAIYQAYVELCNKRGVPPSHD